MAESAEMVTGKRAGANRVGFPLYEWENIGYGFSKGPRKERRPRNSRAAWGGIWHLSGFVLQPIFLFSAEERRSPTLFGGQICLRGPDRLTRVIAQGLRFA